VVFHFQNIFKVSHAIAQSPTIPIFTVYRDAAGWENITTTPQSLSWDTQISQNAEIPADGANTNFDLSIGGHYLVMYSVPIRSTGGGNRSEAQSWVRINGATDSPYGYASSYIRRADNDFEWYNESAAIIDVNPWDDLDIRIQKTDTNTATMQRTPNRSGVNILKLDDTWDYVRARPSSSQAVTTAWQPVNLWTVDELDVSGYSISGNDVTLNEAWKYLVTYNVWTITTGTDRTNNEMRLSLWGSELDATRSTSYIRAQNGSFVGISSYVGIIESTTANEILNLEIRRESTLQWNTNNTIANKTGITIVKLPDSADYVRISEAIGWQDSSLSVNTPLTFDTSIEQGTSLEHDTVATSQIDINDAGDYLFFHSVYNSRNDTSNGPRENPYLQWQVSWTNVSYGVSGSYNRSANDGDGISNSSHSSAWVILPWLSGGDTVELTETNEAGNGSTLYTWWRMWVQWVNLFSLFSGGAFLSQSQYRWRDDSIDFDSDGWWIASENTDISNFSRNDTLRLRMKVENPWDDSYDQDTQFEFQWSKTSGACTPNLTWHPISDANDDWKMVDTSHISPNAETSWTILLSNSWSNTHIQSEWYHAPDGQTLLTPASTFESGSQKEYEFSIQATEVAVSSVSYCFRLFNTAENKALEVNNFAKVQLESVPVILDDVWWEAWKVTAPADGWWTTITFAGGPYTTPVVVGRTNTDNDPNEALVFESRNITSTTAEVRLCDSNAWNSTWCQTHGTETIGYVVVDASQTSSIVWVEAGTFSAGASFDVWAGLITTTYSEAFSAIPYVFTSIQSTVGDSPIVTRVSNSTIGNFTGGICQQNSTDGCNGSHPTETVWWIAIDPTVNPFFRDMSIWTWDSNAVSNIWSAAGFSTVFDVAPVWLSQTVTNLWGQDVQIDEIRSVTTTGMEFRACELDNDDDCDGHAVDTIRWLAIEEWIFASEFLLDVTNYRWYENNSSLTPATSLASENTTLSTIPWSDQLRLRMLIQNSDPALPVSALGLRLQYGSGVSCSAISTWIDVGAPGWTQDWIYYDDPALTDGATIPSSLLFGGGHILQPYIESIPTPTNPNAIPVEQYGEWDFSLMKNTVSPIAQYCFRVVTQNGDDISYSTYARVDTSDAVDPNITSFTPNSDTLFPIGNFAMSYEFNDVDSGIDIGSEIVTLQRWDGSIWWPNIAGGYTSLNAISLTWATYQVTGLEFGRYRAWFWIQDNAGNSDIINHEFYVDEIEFNISQAEIDIWTIAESWTTYTSVDELIVTVRTVWAAFSVSMNPNTDLTNDSETIPIFDTIAGFWYQEPPYPWTILSHTGWIVVGSEAASLNPDGEKNTYTYNLRYSALLDILENYAAGDYEGSVDFGIDINY